MKSARVLLAQLRLANAELTFEQMIEACNDASRGRVHFIFDATIDGGEHWPRAQGVHQAS